MKYRSLEALATAVSLAVVANLGAPLFVGGVAARPVWLGTLLAAGVLSLVFVHRAAQNLETIGDAHPRFTPGQSVGWLLVPLINLYMTHQVLTALWRESQPQPRELRRGGGDFSVTTVNVWLGLTIAGIMLGSGLHEFGARVASAVPTVLRADHLAQGAAFIVVVLRIARRQREQWIDLERRRAAPQPTAAALR